MVGLKIEENKLAAAEVEEKGTKYTILDDARLPLKPSKPEILLIGIVAFVLGLLSGFGCVFMAEFADHSFRGIEDAKIFLKHEILGGIALIVDRSELMAQRAKQRAMVVIVIVAYIAFFAVAAIYSSIRQEETKSKVIEIANKEKAAGGEQGGK
jgi:LPS O-antigen subunit length determinant protein (WzzB/FepE family)